MEKWDFTVSCAETSDDENYVITYSDQEIISKTGTLAFQNRNDFDIVVHLLAAGKKEITCDIRVGGSAIIYEIEKDTEHTVGCHADVDEGIEIKLTIYDGEETEVM